MFDFAPALRDLGDAGIGVAAAPTGGMGFALNPDGSIPDAVLKTLPGYEFAYAENTSGLSVTATTEATAQTLVTASTITLDGGTTIVIEGFAFAWEAPAVASSDIRLILYDNGATIGQLAALRANTTVTQQFVPMIGKARITPTAGLHAYSLRSFISAAGTGVIFAGAGGSSGVSYPAYIRITKA